MKFTNKLMIVPYVNNVPNPNDPIEKYLSSLDEEMSTILNRNDISPQEKLNLYNQSMTKYLAYTNNDALNNKITGWSNDKKKITLDKLISELKPDIKKEIQIEIKKEIEDEKNYEDIQPSLSINDNNKKRKNSLTAKRLMDQSMAGVNKKAKVNKKTILTLAPKKSIKKKND
jgi:hypothetical protein